MNNSSKKRKRVPRTYKKEWEKNFPIIDVHYDRHLFYCLECNCKCSCADKGLGDVRRHCKSFRHCRNVKNSELGIKTCNRNCGFPSKLLRCKDILETNHGHIKPPTSLSLNNMPDSSTAESPIKARSSKNLRKLFTSNIPQKEIILDNNIVEKDLNVLQPVEKLQNVSDTNGNIDMGTDLNLQTGPNILKELRDINEGKS
ncbi:hypothetical protein RF11_04570 [Thelohanellus kitauei]|uniref:Uncharacterized protein n=1 Tax=Thelohanellus kitauei TaxID=669202 RepID=A0A0C2MQG9_THEKT|nr:hypothetical protein RF11_04570 [Thelohanellus kitauei]